MILTVSSREKMGVMNAIQGFIIRLKNRFVYRVIGYAKQLIIGENAYPAGKAMILKEPNAY